jgi:SAM-dependent methyltransferase
VPHVKHLTARKIDHHPLLIGAHLSHADLHIMHDETDSSSPVALEQRGLATDQRMFSPSAARNSVPILAVLSRILPAHGVVLEIGCGTGEHAVCLAEAMPNLTWLPSDPDPGSRASTASWTKSKRLSNVLPPRDIDVCSAQWGVESSAPFDAIVAINMVHIAPWAATLGLFSGAERLLRAGGLLFLYGPFMQNGVHNSPSNAAFDESLRARDPSWGVRDIADLEHAAAASRLRLGETIDMPANNMSLVFVNSML